MTEFERAKENFTKSGMNIKVMDNEIDVVMMWKPDGTPTYIVKMFFNEHGIYDRSEHIEVTA